VSECARRRFFLTSQDNLGGDMAGPLSCIAEKTSAWRNNAPWRRLPGGGAEVRGAASMRCGADRHTRARALPSPRRGTAGGAPDKPTSPGVHGLELARARWRRTTESGAPRGRHDEKPWEDTWRRALRSPAATRRILREAAPCGDCSCRRGRRLDLGKVCEPRGQNLCQTLFFVNFRRSRTYFSENRT
jgi:hypothetical protein